MEAWERVPEGGRGQLGADGAYEPHQAPLDGRERGAGGLALLDPRGTAVG